MTVYLASDHAGFALKGALVIALKSEGHTIEDLGPHTLDAEDDYPDYIVPLAERVAEHTGSFGIAIGGSGEGEAIVANKVDGIRAAEYYGGNLDIVRLSREHNDANVLALGARFLSEEEALEAVRLWLSTPFSGDERHVRRLKKVDEL